MEARPAPPRLHELEAEVMGEVWRRGEATVRDVMEGLNTQARRPRAYTTYMTTLSRLDGKGLLERRREGKCDIYSASLTAEEYREARARSEVGALVEQFGDSALVHFSRQWAELDPERQRQLRRVARRDDG